MEQQQENYPGQQSCLATKYPLGDSKGVLDGFPWWPSIKKICLQCRRLGRLGFHLWVGKIPWVRKDPWCQLTPVFLPGESHGQRSLASYRPENLRRVGHDWVTEHTHRVCQADGLSDIDQVILDWLISDSISGKTETNFLSLSLVMRGFA